MTLSSFSLNMQQKALEFLQRRTPVALPNHLLTGLRGEQAALFHLRRQGFTITAHRWSSPRLRGDLDLVGWENAADSSPTLVIFEVKTRTARDFAPADTAVDENKQRQLRLVTRAYLRQFPRAHRETIAVRFDVLSVYLLPAGAEFEHFRGAFPFRA